MGREGAYPGLWGREWHCGALWGRWAAYGASRAYGRAHVLPYLCALLPALLSAPALSLCPGTAAGRYAYAHAALCPAAATVSGRVWCPAGGAWRVFWGVFRGVSRIVLCVFPGSRAACLRWWERRRVLAGPPIAPSLSVS